MEAQTVLVVDDDAGFRDNLKDILEERDYRILCAGTCKEALQLAEEFRPMAALLDIKLPDGSGTALLAGLKRIHGECVCVMMTAFADLGTALEALDQGAFQYLQKPVRPPELLNLLRRIFDTVRLRQEKTRADAKLRQSERTMHSILDAYPSAALLIDPMGQIVATNRKVAKLMGKSAEEVEGIHTSTLASKEINENRKQKAQEVIRTGEAVRFEEESDGRYLDTIVSPVPDDSGKVGFLAVFSQDITARKRAEEEKRKLEASLAHAQRMEAIGTLAGGIAHDFNNLLQGILGYTEILLMDKAKDDPEYGTLTEVEKAACRASELTKQLLTFSRKVESELKSVDLNQVVRQVEKLLRRTIPRMIEIELDLEKNLSAINADPAQMEQILMNLAVNARDAMPDGGVLVVGTGNVTLDEEFCKRVPECTPGGYVLLRVMDTGKGMDGKTLEHIFEPFFTTKEVGKGTGLGLAMVFGIVKGHRGHISCESTPGLGTSFSIYLPVAQRQRLEVPEEAGDETPLRGSETILVVEDEENLRDLARQVLRKFGYKVIVAEKGESALGLYEKGQGEISLVLLDLIMPGMGGRRCLEELLRRDPTVKEVIASGYTGENSMSVLLET